jgi:class 3 adenylate cyclase
MKRKIAAIMAADIAGYSKLVAEDEEETLRRLASYRSVFDDFIAKASGRIFNTAGDAVLAEFPSAVEAVRCAIDIQESLRTRNLAYPPSRQMNFRIGITVGDVVERDGDLLGDGVNIAARLEGLAEPGGICVSRSIYEQVTNKLSVRFADIGEQQVKNIPTPIHAYVVSSPGHEQAPIPARGIPWPAVIGAACVAAVVTAGGIYWVANMSKPLPTVAMQAPAKPAVKTPAQTAPAASVQPQPPQQALQKAAPPNPPAQTAVADAAPTAEPPASRIDETKLRGLAGQLSLPLPRTVHLVEPLADVPKKSSEFLGAWGGDRRWGGRGRQMILVVTYVAASGEATGIISFGPPTPFTDNQRPANYWVFNGTIRDDDLKFVSPDGQYKYQFRIMPDGIMQGRLETPSNRHPQISIERIN